MNKILLAIAALVLLSGPAFAQSIQCSTLDKVKAILGGSQYGETVAAAGIASNGRLLEIYTNEVTGSFSMTMRSANRDEVCLILAGEGFRIKSDKQRKQEMIDKLPQY